MARREFPTLQKVKTSYCALLILPVLCAAQPYPSVAFGISDPDGILSMETNPAGLATMNKAELALQSGGAQPMGQDLVRIQPGPVLQFENKFSIGAGAGIVH